MLYSDWAWDRGMGGKAGDNYNQGWRVWKMGVFDGATNSAIIAGLGSSSAAANGSASVICDPMCIWTPTMWMLGDCDARA